MWNNIRFKYMLYEVKLRRILFVLHTYVYFGNDSFTRFYHRVELLHVNHQSSLFK